MNRQTCLALIAFAALVPVAFAQDDVSAAARAVLKTHCYQCHNGENSDSGLPFDVLRPETLFAPASDDRPIVVAGKPDESKLWQVAGVKKSMPLKSVKERPTDAELAALRKWIEAGAPAFVTEKIARKSVSLTDVLTAVRDDLRAADAEDRPYLRYFTLTHLHNNPRVPDADLNVYRAALSKAINSLSWKHRIVLPRAVDAPQTVFAVDLRDLGWDRDHLWAAVQAAYCYGLKHDTHPDAAVRKLDNDVHGLTDCELPLIRGDWFAAVATRPPLYHLLLKLPMTAGELEAKLEVDAIANFRRDRLMRAGFAHSGVSEQNRLIERHEALYGAYWKSYDFKKDNADANLIKKPLGPAYAGHPHPAQAFVQDGGELIFNLPNGLQGYMLVDGKDVRIDAGPIEVVNDSRKTSGSPVIVNGVSCMACHRNGPIAPPLDDVRSGAAVFGEPRRKVERLYPERDALMKRIREDEERFLKAAEEATGPFLKVGADKDKSIRDFPEPVGEIARLHGLQELDLAMAACELGLDKPQTLSDAIKASKELREIGLTPLCRGGVLKRADWEVSGPYSQMQRAAQRLELGTPVRTLNPSSSPEKGHKP